MSDDRQQIPPPGVTAAQVRTLIAGWRAKAAALSGVPGQERDLMEGMAVAYTECADMLTALATGRPGTVAPGEKGIPDVH